MTEEKREPPKTEGLRQGQAPAGDFSPKAKQADACARRLRENKRRKVAGVTRLELATSGVTGQRSNQLSYTPRLKGP